MLFLSTVIGIILSQSISIIVVLWMPRTVSVVLPTYNRLSDFGRALASLAVQSFANFEVVIVDDGSTEPLERVVKEINLPAVNFIRHPVNKGAAAARNTGILNARGDWIAFLDSDDTWEPDKLARQLAHLEGAGKGFLASSTGYRLHRDNQVKSVSPLMAPGRFQKEILFGCTICPGSTLIVERRVFNDIGFFDESLRRLEDWDWLLRFAERHDISILPDALVDIYLSKPTPRADKTTIDPIFHAIDTIALKHITRLRAKGPIALAQFRSTLYTERAARAYHENRGFRAVSYALASLAIYPWRNAAYFQSLWRSLREMLRTRRIM